MSLPCFDRRALLVAVAVFFFAAVAAAAVQSAPLNAQLRSVEEKLQETEEQWRAKMGDIEQRYREREKKVCTLFFCVTSPSGAF